jgi:hypothetical protein
MMLGLLIGALIGAVAVFARAKVGVLALVACILTAGAVTAVVRQSSSIGIRLAGDGCSADVVPASRLCAGIPTRTSQSARHADCDYEH